jgi:hypothetical protein
MVIVLEKLTDHSDNSIRFAAISILLMTRKINNTRFIDGLSKLTLGVEGDEHYHNSLDQILVRSELPIAQRADLAVELVDLFKFRSRELSSNFKIRLRTLLDSELSGLASNEMWSSLKLPADAYLSIN